MSRHHLDVVPPRRRAYKRRLGLEVEILKRAAAYFARENILPNWLVAVDGLWDEARPVNPAGAQQAKVFAAAPGAGAD